MFVHFLGTSVDVGYENLRQNINLSLDGIACDNGIIYVIKGFLNISLRTILQVMEAQDILRYALQTIMMFCNIC